MDEERPPVAGMPLPLHVALVFQVVEQGSRPGLVVIALALAVFAVEYEWARRRLATVRERALSAALKAAASRAATACAVLFGVGESADGPVALPP